MQIDIKDIIVPEGRRALDPVKVAEIAASIKVVGLLSPIGVFDAIVQLPNGGLGAHKTLVWGAHRLAACERLGWTTITATYIGADYLVESDVKMMEIAENLHRAELTTQERNEHLAEWVKRADA